MVVAPILHLRWILKIFRVLKNEIYLRALSRNQIVKSQPDAWKYGLVRIEDLPKILANVKTVSSLSNTKTIALKLTRDDVSSLAGLTVLGAKRRSALLLQPSLDQYKSRWTTLTAICSRVLIGPTCSLRVDVHWARC
jgi:hypothetical protein